MPDWAGVPIDTKAKYLGCIIGPGKIGQEWKAPLKKFLSKVKEWDWASLGTLFARMTYNIYMLPTLMFTAQVAEVSPEVLQAGKEALRKTMPGPRQGILEEDMWNLKEYGLKSFGSVQTSARAVLLRVLTKENEVNGGLKVNLALDQLKRVTEDPIELGRTSWWAPWLRGAIPKILEANRKQLASWKIEAGHIERQISKDMARPWDRRTTHRVRRDFQKVTRGKVEARLVYDPVARTRHNLQRWFEPDMVPPLLDGIPASIAGRFVNRRRRAANLVPPRVMAASFNTAWNRWCTARRSCKRNDPSNICQLGCGSLAEDSIEHYARCEQLRVFHRSKLRITSDNLMHHWIGTRPAHCCSEEELACGLLGAYVAYKTTNAARKAGGFSKEEAKRGHGTSSSGSYLGSPKGDQHNQ